MYTHKIVHILNHIVDIHEKGMYTHIFVYIQKCISLSRIHKNAGEIFFNSTFT